MGGVGPCRGREGAGRGVGCARPWAGDGRTEVFPVVRERLALALPGVRLGALSGAAAAWGVTVFQVSVESGFEFVGGCLVVEFRARYVGWVWFMNGTAWGPYGPVACVSRCP